MLLLTGIISLASLPMILLYLLIICLFLWLVWFILSKFPGPIATWAWTIVVVLAGIILLLFLISLVGGGSVVHGQTLEKTEPRATHTCIVMENAIVDCGDFTLNIGTPWPEAWKGKSEGDTVFVHREGAQALPVSNAPPSCRERIQAAFRSLCLGGECARMDIDNERLTPRECLSIDRNERISYTKELSK